MQKLLQNFNFVRLSRLALSFCLVMVMAMNVGWGQTYNLTPNASSTGSTATSYITSLTEFTHNGVTWKMNQWNPSTLQIKTNQNSPASEFRFYNTTAFPGKITQVVIKFSALTLSNTSNTGFMFVGGTSEVTATSGGTAGTWDATATTITWTPGASDNFTYFAFYQNGKVATGTNKLATSDAIVVTYETSATSAPTTVTINTSGITNTDVYTSTSAGSLSATVKDNNNAVVNGATVTWSSSNENVATIANDGTITLVAVGSTTITASYAGVSGQYDPSSAQYTLDVTSSAPYVQPTSIEIVPNYAFWGMTAQFSGDTYSQLSGGQDDVSLNWTKGSGSTYANSSAMRFYKDNNLTFTAPEGYEFISIKLTVSGTYSDLTFSPTGFDNETQTWTGAAETVTMSRPSNASSYATISKFTITLAAIGNAVATTTTINVPANFNNDIYQGTNAGTLTATVKDNENNTISGATVTWESSNTGVATIDANGVVTLVAVGTTTITASYAGVEDEYRPSAGTYELTVTDSNAPGTQNNPYTVAQAIDAIDNDGNVTNVYATGVVSQVTYYSQNNHYITYYISADGSTTGDQLEAFHGKGINGADFSSIDDIQVGDVVVIKGNLMYYSQSSTYEFAENNQLVSLVRPAQYTLTDAMTDVAEYFVFVGDDEIEFDNNNQAQVRAGATVYVSLTMEDCYALTSVTVNGSTTGVTEIEPGIYYSFVMPEGDATIGVSATQATQYTLTVVGLNNVTYTDMLAGVGSEEVTLTNNQATLCEGINVDIAGLSANEGLLLQSVTLNDGTTTTTLELDYGVYHFTMPSSNATLTFTTSTPSTYTLANSIESGKTYIIVGFGGNDAYAMGVQNTNNRAGVGITVDGNTATGNAEVHEVVITALGGDDAGKYTIEDGGYLYASSSSSNQLKTETTLNANGKWTIVIENGEATITAQGTNTRNLMRFNPNNGSPLFACYASNSTTGSLPRLYVKDEISTEPSITVTPSPINVNAEGGNGTITVTYNNITQIVAEVQFCNAQGEAATYDWITATINSDNNVEYSVANNTGAARTAYFKVYALDNEASDVYSNLVTVTQAEYVIDYATLPFVYDGNGTNLPTGLTQSGVGTYTSSPAMKFDNTDDWVILKFNERPGTLTFDIKGNSFSGGTFKVQTSEDGTTYSDLETYTSLGDLQSEIFGELGENVRYIKWIYTNKSSGNVALGNIRLSAYQAYTVNFNAGTGSCESDAITANYFTFPAATTDCDGYTFAGWASAPVESTPSAPAQLWQPGDPYFPTENVTFYAVYTNGENGWTRATSLNVGDVVYLVNENSKKEFSDFSSYSTSINTGYGEVVSYEDHPNGVKPLVVEQGSAVGSFAFHTNDNYYVEGTTGGSNDHYLIPSTALSESSSWTVEIDNDGNATITNVNFNTSKLQYNSSQPRFACYTSAQQPVQLYKHTTTGEYTSNPCSGYTVYFYEGTGDCGVVSLKGSSVELPVATIASADWTFAGWSEAPVNETATAPSMVASPYAPAEDLNLYAIYHNAATGKYYSFPTIATTQLDVTEGFETYINAEDVEDSYGRTFLKPDGWVVAAQFEPMGLSKKGRPFIRKNPNFAHSGNFCLSMDTLSLMVMPKLADGIDLNNVVLELYVRQPYDFQSIQVGFMTDLTNPESFVRVATIDNSGSAVNRRIVDFSQYPDIIPANARFIAFKNLYDEENGMRKSFNHIDDITLSLVENDNTCGITQLPSVWTFEDSDTNTAKVADCWTLANRDKYSNAQYDPQILSQAYYAHDGNASLKLDGEGLFAMPEFLVDGTSLTDVTLELFVRQYSANCKLKVGVMTDVNDPNTFTEILTITNNGASGHTRHVVDFSQYANSIPTGARFIAFRNFYEGNWGRSINYLDDITLSLATTAPDAVAEMPQTQGEESEEYVDDSANTDFEEVMAPTGISDFDLSNLTVYPNPTTGMVTIVAEEVNRVEVYNQIGVLVARYTNEQVIDLGNLSSGIYVLRVTTPQGVAIRKVVKK